MASLLIEDDESMDALLFRYAAPFFIYVETVKKLCANKTISANIKELRNTCIFWKCIESTRDLLSHAIIYETESMIENIICNICCLIKLTGIEICEKRESYKKYSDRNTIRYSKNYINLNDPNFDEISFSDLKQSFDKMGKNSQEQNNNANRQLYCLFFKIVHHLVSKRDTGFKKITKKFQDYNVLDTI